MSNIYNTDKKIHDLILMISRLINQRVIETIKLQAFEIPYDLKNDVEVCVKILETWKKSFFKVRMDIEESRKEERWEFEINDLFADTNHITVICKDILIICNILIDCLEISITKWLKKLPWEQNRGYNVREHKKLDQKQV